MSGEVGRGGERCHHDQLSHVSDLWHVERYNMPILCDIFGLFLCALTNFRSGRIKKTPLGSGAMMCVFVSGLGIFCRMPATQSNHAHERTAKQPYRPWNGNGGDTDFGNVEAIFRTGSSKALVDQE